MNKDTLRTILANERTMLAYVRTALAVAVFGIVVLKFFYESALLVMIGWVSVAGGIFVFGWGMFEYARRDRGIRKTDAGGDE